MSKTGTPPYFSPERGNEQAHGAMADMWALGASAPWSLRWAGASRTLTCKIGAQVMSAHEYM